MVGARRVLSKNNRFLNLTAHVKATGEESKE